MGVCGWIRLESVASGTDSQWPFAPAHRGIKARDPSLWRRQAVPSGPGRAVTLADSLAGRRARVLRYSASRVERPATLFFQGKTDLQCHLPMGDFAILDESASLGHLKPSHVA